MYQANVDATGVGPHTGDMSLKTTRTVSRQATLASKSFCRKVSIDEWALAMGVKRQAECDNSVAADLRDKSCKMTEAGLTDQNSLKKTAQKIFIGNREYTRQELSEISTKELNLLLKKENSKEVESFVRYIRRAEKNRRHQAGYRKGVMANKQAVANEVKMLKSEKNRLELEKKSLIMGKNKLELENRAIVALKNRLELENRFLITEKNRLEIELRSQIAEKNNIWKQYQAIMQGIAVQPGERSTQ
ncbi:MULTISPECIES: hypothetical protein [unclassified Endozoicomonas]|uniref:hypothetical protein n=1 Tax=unclassified Endozoicomonas TaxID=2644528 RepID=UPI003BB535B0